MRETESRESRLLRLGLGLAACAAIAVAILGAAPILLPAVTSQVEPAEDAGRGTAVAVDGEWLAVGARFADRFEPSTGNVEVRVVPGPHGAKAERVGAAYLYQRTGDVWLERHKLIAGDARPGDQFGSAVALQGDVLAVGAPGWSRGAEPRQGAVYLYRQVDGEWILKAVVTLCGNDSIDRLGRSLALDGIWLAITGTGKVCFYPVTLAPASAPKQLGMQLQPAAVSGEDTRSGESVAISGDIVAAGSPGAEQARGKVEVFRLVGPGWILKRTLRAPGGLPFDQFGSAVAVSGNRIAVGAVGASVGGPRSGAVYVFDASGSDSDSDWTALLPPITAPEQHKGDRFGAALAMDGDLLVVGAPPLPLPAGHGPLPPPLPGTAYVYNLGTTPASLIGTLRSGSSGKLDLFGAAVAIRGGEVVIGAPLAGTGGDNAGSSWAFHCTPAGCSPEGELVPLTVLPDSPGKLPQ